MEKRKKFIFRPEWAKYMYWVSLWFFLEAFIFGNGNASLCKNLSNISFGVMFFCMLLATILWINPKNSRDAKSEIQILGMFLILSIFWNVNFGCTRNASINMLMACIGLLSLNICAVLLLFHFLKTKQYLNIISRNTWKKYIGLYGILILYAILSIQDFGIWFKGDSYIYYNAILRGKDTWDFTLNDLSAFRMGGHTTYAYAFFLYIGEYLWHALGNGIRLMNILLAEITIACFYGICVKLFKKSDVIEQTLLTAIFAFAPLLFGTSYLVNSDFPMLCFFVIFVFAYMHQLKVLQYLSALALCFSKEIAILILAGFYLGECIYAAINRKKNCKISYIIREIFSVNRILMYSGVFFYLIPAFLLKDGWMKNLRVLLVKTSEQSSKKYPDLIVKWHYYVYKAEEMFCMNFMWVLLVVVVFLMGREVIVKFRKKKKSEKSLWLRNPMILPLFFSWSMFAFISIYYFTYVHYRYVQLNLFFMVLLLGSAVELIRKRRIKYGALSGILVLFLCESYILLDPLTYMMLPKFNAGNKNMVSTRRYFYGGEPYGFGYIESDQEIVVEHYLHEGLDYNRQEIGLQRVLEKAFDEIDYKSRKLVVLQNFGGWLQNDCWQLFGANRSNGYYWDEKLKTIKNENLGNEEIHFEISASDETMEQYDEVYYFSFTFNKYAKDEFLKKKKILQEFEVSNGAWKIKVYKVK
ncbi:MAG: hypothetical protein ACI4HI_18715 [Lachnospiraceae bacterium]